MKKLIALLLLTPFILRAEEEDRKRVMQIYRTSTELDENLGKQDAVYEFKFSTAYGNMPKSSEIRYSIDGKNSKAKTKNNTIIIETNPGKHIFQFYYNENYQEVYSDSLEIKSRHRDTYAVSLYQAYVIEEAEKPVIYFYPEEPTEVTVKMDIHGENQFLYPAYDGAWKFTAHPNGDLNFGDETYNYLFWEATTRTLLSPKQMISGFFVKGDEAVQFLEEKLTTAGLNSKEQADFITYWGPRLAMNKLNFVHFEFNETCEKYADLNISPKPDNVYRIFMVWGSVSERFEAEEQDIEKMNRTGFSVLEWGGQESHIKQSFCME